MAIDFSIVTNTAYGFLSQAWVWGLVVILAGVGFIVALKMKRAKKMRWGIAMIYTILANGKVGINIMPMGWLKKRRVLGGLLELKSDEELVTKDLRKIYGFDPTDYIEYDGKKALALTPNPENPDQLFPINSFTLDPRSKKMFMEICPMDMTEVAGEEFKKATEDMKDNTARVMELVGLAILVIGIVLALIFITQYWKAGLDNAQKINAQTTASNEKVSNNLVEILNKCGAGAYVNNGGGLNNPA